MISDFNDEILCFWDDVKIERGDTKSMALINCPECNKEISDTVKKCPHCGIKIKGYKKKSMSLKTKKILAISGVIIAICIVALLGGNAIFGMDKSEKTQVVILNNKISEKMEFELDEKSESELETYKSSCGEIFEAYEQLRWKQKIRIKGFDDFEKKGKDVEAKIEQIRSDEIQKVVSLIDAIGEVTLDSQKKVNDAEEAFGKLDENQKSKVTNSNLVLEARTRLDELNVEYTVDLINHIGKVSLENDSEGNITKSEQVYNGLSSESKKKVSNYNILLSKRKEYNKLEKYKVLLTGAQSNMKNGNLNTAAKKLKRIPVNFKYKNTKVKTLKKQLSSKKMWLSLCGKWKSTSGMMKVYEIWDYDGRWENWHRKISKGEEYISVYCSLLKSGKVKVKISGDIPCYTKYSSISEGLETDTISLDKTVTMSSMGKVKIDKYTTITLSASGISVNYYRVNPNESQNFTYKYTSTMACKKRVEKY